MRVHHNARRRLARLVQPRRIRRANVDPDLHGARQVADCERGNIGSAMPLEKPMPSRYSRQYARTRETDTPRSPDGWRDADGEGFIHPSIYVGELDLEVVDRCCERHAAEVRRSLIAAPPITTYPLCVEVDGAQRRQQRREILGGSRVLHFDALDLMESE